MWHMTVMRTSGSMVVTFSNRLNQKMTDAAGLWHVCKLHPPIKKLSR